MRTLMVCIYVSLSANIGRHYHNKMMCECVLTYVTANVYVFLLYSVLWPNVHKLTYIHIHVLVLLRTLGCSAAHTSISLKQMRIIVCIHARVLKSEHAKKQRNIGENVFTFMLYGWCISKRERTQGECMMIAYKYKQVFLNNIKYVEVNDKRKRKLNPFHFCHRNF